MTASSSLGRPTAWGYPIASRGRRRMSAAVRARRRRGPLLCVRPGHLRRGRPLELAAWHVPDVVILDLGLPAGVEVIRGLRGADQRPHIILSARDAGGQGGRARRRRRRLRDQALRHGRALRPAACRAPAVGPPRHLARDRADFTVDLAAKRVTNAAGEVRLTPIEWPSSPPGGVRSPKDPPPPRGGSGRIIRLSGGPGQPNAVAIRMTPRALGNARTCAGFSSDASAPSGANTRPRVSASSCGVQASPLPHRPKVARKAGRAAIIPGSSPRRGQLFRAPYSHSAITRRR